MWAMKWDGIRTIAAPYPNVAGFAVTEGMREKNMTVNGMFKLADEFYRSLGKQSVTQFPFSLTGCPWPRIADCLLLCETYFKGPQLTLN